MDGSLLKTWTRVAGALWCCTLWGCSLVVDTDECASDADCDFGDGTELQCVSRECVPASRRSQALVRGSLEEDATWSTETNWVVDGVVVVERDVTLTIDSGAIVEMRPGSLLVVTEGATLETKDARPELAPFLIDENLGDCR